MVDRLGRKRRWRSGRGWVVGCGATLTFLFMFCFVGIGTTYYVTHRHKADRAKPPAPGTYTVNLRDGNMRLASVVVTTSTLRFVIQQPDGEYDCPGLTDVGDVPNVVLAGTDDAKTAPIAWTCWEPANAGHKLVAAQDNPLTMTATFRQDKRFGETFRLCWLNLANFPVVLPGPARPPSAGSTSRRTARASSGCPRRPGRTPTS